MINGLNVNDTDPRPQTELWCESDIGGLNKPEGKTTEEELKSVLKRYNLRDGLIYLGQISMQVFSDHSENKIGKTGYREPKTGVFITQFALAYISNILLISGSNDYKAKQISNRQNLLTLCNIYSNSIISPELSRGGRPLTSDDFVSTMVRMYLEQFETQFNPVFLIMRTIIIFSEICETKLPPKFQRLSEIFKKEVGLSIDDYFSLVVAIWAGAQQTSTFRINMFTQSTLPEMSSVLTEEKIKKFISILTCDYSIFRNIDNRMNSKLDPVFTKTRFNPIQIYPIIESDKQDTDPYIIPNCQMYIKKAFGGIYWWFHTYFEKTSQHLDFRIYFGALFEEYVGMILKETYGHTEVMPELLYPKGRFIDWWIPKGDKIYLFEAKSYQFALETKQTGNIERLLKEVKTKIAESVEQIYDRIKDVENYKELSMFKGKRLIPTIIFLDIPFVSAYIYKDFIKTELEAMEKKGKKGIVDLDVFFLNIEELELYQGSHGAVDIEDIIANYKKNPAEGFSSMLIKKVNTEPLENNYLGKRYNSFWSKMTKLPEDELKRHEG